MEIMQKQFNISFNHTVIYLFYITSCFQIINYNVDYLQEVLEAIIKQLEWKCKLNIKES